MYCRKDQERYYRRVLLPLEKNAIRRRNWARMRRRCALGFADMRKALRARNLGRFCRSAKRFINTERQEYGRFRREYRSAEGLSPGTLCFSDQRIAVYTAIFGRYDTLQEPLFCPDNVDYFVITDGEVRAGSKWIRLPWDGFPQDEPMTDADKNRYVKMFPHLLFPSYAYSVYMDGNILVAADFTPLAMRAADYPVAMHMHKDRDCVYEEIDACIEKRKDTPEALSRQRSVLQDLGVPAHWGLLEAPVIARRHHDPRCREIMEKWWACYRAGCRRDQIALIRCLWELGIDPRRLGGLGASVMASNSFIWSAHKRA